MDARVYNELVTQAINELLLRCYAYSAVWFLLGLWTGWFLRKNSSPDKNRPAVIETGNNNDKSYREGIKEPVKVTSATSFMRRTLIDRANRKDH